MPSHCSSYRIYGLLSVLHSILGAIFKSDPSKVKSCLEVILSQIGSPFAPASISITSNSLLKFSANVRTPPCMEEIYRIKVIGQERLARTRNSFSFNQAELVELPGD